MSNNLDLSTSAPKATTCGMRRMRADRSRHRADGDEIRASDAAVEQ